MEPSKAAFVQAQKHTTDAAVVVNTFALHMSSALTKLVEWAQLVEVIGLVQAKGPDLLCRQIGRGVAGVPSAQGSGFQLEWFLNGRAVQPFGKVHQLVGQQFLHRLVCSRGVIEVFPQNVGVGREPVKCLEKDTAHVPLPAAVVPFSRRASLVAGRYRYHSERYMHPSNLHCS